MKKQVVLITGVSREEGIGFGVAKLISEQGFEVIISARSREKAEQLAKKLSSNGNAVLAKELDIESEESVKQLAEFIKGRYQRLDVLINNAGGRFDMGIQPLETSLDNTKETFDINLFGAWRMIQHFYPLLKESDQSRIVNISSGAGSFEDPVFGLGVHQGYVTSYGLSKLALNGLTVKLARQFKEAGDNIKINSVCPGFVATYPGTKEYGARPVSEAVPGIVWAATLSKDGPTGGFFRDKEALAW